MGKARTASTPHLYSITGGLGMTAAEMAAIGRLTATLEAVKETVEGVDTKVDGIDARLRAVEINAGTRAAVDTERVRQGVESAITRRWIVSLVVAPSCRSPG